MNRVMGFIIRTLLIVLVLALLGAGGWLLYTYCGWTWQELLALSLGLLVLVLAVALVRHFYYKRREQKYLRHMVEQDTPSLSAKSNDSNIARLRESWRTGIQTLENSLLPDQGNAVYSLPWFMLFGESGTGKSTAVMHSRMAALAGANAATAQKPASTRNCDWWFFKNAVVLDTAGHYAVPVNGESDEREWQEFVRLISAYRQKEPLNGLILTLSTEQLERGAESLTAYGHNLRKGIHTLSRAMGAHFPIYILVTKVDRILGFNELGSLLTEEECHQALGLLNEKNETTVSTDSRAFLEKALGHVRQRLQDLSMLLCEKNRQDASRILALPEELSRCFPGIRAFADAVFAPSSYDKTPNLRGIFFSSGSQSGAVSSSLLADLETFKDVSWAQPGTNKSLFLSDFFSCILPKERPISDIADRWLSRQSFRRYVPYLFFLLLLLVLNAYFTVSFKIHMNNMQMRQKNIPVAVPLDANLNKRVDSLSVAADTILAFEKDVADQSFLIPGRRQANAVLDSLKHNYVNWVRPDLIFPDKDKVDQTMTVLPPDKSRNLLVSFCDYTTWTSTIFDGVKTGAELPEPRDQMDPFLANMEEFLPYSSVHLRNVLVNYAKWENPHIRDTVTADKSSSINAFLYILGSNLDWLTDWLNQRPTLKPVTLTNFWPAGPNAPAVPPAFTVDGFKRMESILERMNAAINEKENFGVLAQQYRTKYADELRAAWWNLASAFPIGLQNNISRDSWTLLNVSMSGYDNPYFSFILAMADAFKLVENWGTPTMQDSLVLAFAEVLKFQKQNDSPNTLNKTIQAKKEEFAAKISEKAAQALQDRAAASAELANYHKALLDLRQSTETMPKALTTMSSVFKGGEEAAGTALIKAMQSVESLQIQATGTNKKQDEFWRLIKGPLAWYTYIAILRSATELNTIWESVVLNPLTLMPQDSILEMLYDEQSPVNKFAQGPCQPFLSMTQGKYLPASWKGLRYPLRPEFLEFLDQGLNPANKAQEKYTVNITALPVNVNDMAIKPHRARLRLDCGDKSQILDNYNYEVSTSFTWEPAVCGRVSLEFTFDKQTVTTTWEDEWAFQTFLKDFSGGEVLLTPEDFPGQEDVLQELDVKEIRVRYAIRNASEALMATRTPLVPVPAEVANATDAWDNNSLSNFSSLLLNDLPLTVLPQSKLYDKKKGKAVQKGARQQTKGAFSRPVPNTAPGAVPAGAPASLQRSSN